MDDEAVFGDLKEAYEVLTTPDRRDEYDRAAWGETFAPGTGFAAGTSFAAGGTEATLLPVAAPAAPGAAPVIRCPLGIESACPALTGRTGPGDTYCPDCGYLLAGLTATGFGPGTAPDARRLPRLEEPGGQVHLLRAGVTVVGREGTDILLPDKTVSRRHAQVTVAGDGAVTVEDMGSTNGTQVGGEALVPHVPRRAFAGDRVRFGSVLTELHLPDPALPDPALGDAPDPSLSPSPTLPPPSLTGKGAGGLGPSDEIAESALARLSELREDDPRTYPLPPGVTTFGRRADNTVVLSGDPYVSGSHAQVAATEGGFILTDTGSTNGTLLNGERLAVNAPVRLTPGDVVLIGGTALRFEQPGVGGEDKDAEPTPAEDGDPSLLGKGGEKAEDTKSTEAAEAG